MTEPRLPIQLQLTEEQQAMIHRITGERAAFLELIPDEGDATSGEGRGLNFGWRLSVDSGIPRQQWILARKHQSPSADEGASG